MIEIENLCIKFGEREVVHNANLEIKKGEMVGLVGESGSGKSVTALSILQLLNSARLKGSIKFDGQELMGASEKILRKIRGNKIGIIFQEPMTSLNPLHTIGKQIAEAIEIHAGISRQQVRERVQQLLDLVELGKLKSRLDAYPHQLSGGQRQRVMIAMAIANNPDLLIADEPTTALDVIVAGKILRLLKKIQKELGMSILLITHDLTVIEQLSDRVYVMKDGNIVESGQTVRVFHAPRHEYTKFLLASAPKGSAIRASKSPVVVVRGNNLTVKFPIKSGFFGNKKGEVIAVDNVSVAIAEGKTLGIAGESGSGKTTLGLALMRLIESEGEIGFMGNKIK